VEEVQEATRVLAVARTSGTGVVVEEGRATPVPARHPGLGFAKPSRKISLTMDIKQPRIK
jgi:hypothetical protein